MNVFIVEDKERPRASLRALIAGSPGFACGGDCGSGEEALRLIPASGAQLVVMDIRLPGMSGVECARTLKVLRPDLQVVMLTEHDDPELIFDALRAGASGYVLKYEPPARILEALEQVHRGGGWMTPAVARSVMRSFEPGAAAAPGADGLTAREREILELMRSGATTSKQIGGLLQLSERTVDGHLRGIYHKLHVRSRTAALAKYVARNTPPRSD